MRHTRCRLSASRSLARARHPAVRLSRARRRVSREVPARGIVVAAVRRQLELARADLDAGQRPADSGAAAVLPLLRRLVPRRVPDRLRTHDESVRGRGRNHRAAHADLPSRRARTPPRVRRTDKFQSDPHWRDHLLFYEYFHGDNGAGLGASHQTGWSGLVATFIELFGNVKAAEFLEGGKLMLYRPPVSAAAASATAAARAVDGHASVRKSA